MWRGPWEAKLNFDLLEKLRKEKQYMFKLNTNIQLILDSLCEYGNPESGLEIFLITFVFLQVGPLFHM